MGNNKWWVRAVIYAMLGVMLLSTLVFSLQIIFQ